MQNNIGGYAFHVKAQMPDYFFNDVCMENTSRKILAANLAKLMRLDDPDRTRRVTQGFVGKKAGCNQRTIGRILNGEQAATVDILDGIGIAFGLQPWQLLMPGLDPSNPPINHLTEAEKRLYERLKEAARQVMDAGTSGYKVDP